MQLSVAVGVSNYDESATEGSWHLYRPMSHITRWKSQRLDRNVRLSTTLFPYVSIPAGYEWFLFRPKISVNQAGQRESPESPRQSPEQDEGDGLEVARNFAMSKHLREQCHVE